MTELVKPNYDECSTTTLDSEFSRPKKYVNTCGFSDEVLRRREKEMIELQKVYPQMCSSMIELAWNFCEYTPKEEQDRIIREKEFEKPPKPRLMGGTIKNAITVESRDLSGN